MTSEKNLQKNDSQLLLDIRDLEVSYGAIQAVKKVSLNVKKGERVCLIGANGAGKTSILKAIAKMIPSKGHIEYLGNNLQKNLSHELISKGVALVPEGRGVFSKMTIAENLSLGSYWLNAKHFEEDKESLFEILPRLKERYHQKAGTLSGGEQQMLAIGRALMGRPKLLLLDEPSLGLAPLLINTIFDLINTISAQGITTLLVEQNARKALKNCQRGYVVHCGEITISGSSDELLSDERVQSAYLGI